MKKLRLLIKSFDVISKIMIFNMLLMITVLISRIFIVFYLTDFLLILNLIQFGLLMISFRNLIKRINERK